MNQSERSLSVSDATVAHAERSVPVALDLAAYGQALYRQAPATVRPVNQTFFERLFVSADGTVRRSELAQPFAQMLAPRPGRARQPDPGHEEPRPPLGGARVLKKCFW